MYNNLTIDPAISTIKMDQTKKSSRSVEDELIALFELIASMHHDRKWSAFDSQQLTVLAHDLKNTNKIRALSDKSALLCGMVGAIGAFVAPVITPKLQPFFVMSAPYLSQGQQVHHISKFLPALISKAADSASGYYDQNNKVTMVEIDHAYQGLGTQLHDLATRRQELDRAIDRSVDDAERISQMVQQSFKSMLSNNN